MSAPAAVEIGCDVDGVPQCGGLLRARDRAEHDRLMSMPRRIGIPVVAPAAAGSSKADCVSFPEL